MMLILRICFEFFKTGLFAVGGGLATIPFLREISIRYGWYTLEQLTTMIAISESTPGPMGVNMATFVGFSTMGIPGALAATLSLVAPSVIIVCIIAKMLEKFKNSKIIQGIFLGLRPAVVGFILTAVLSIYLMTLFNIPAFQSSGNIMDLWNWKTIIFFGLLLAFYQWKNKIHPIFLIVISAIVGIVFAF